MTETLYMYNMDAYIGYLEYINGKLIFTREDTTHCWRVETIINRYKLNQGTLDLYQALVTDRAYVGGNHWEAFKKHMGRFVSDNLWFSISKVDADYFWKLNEDNLWFKRVYDLAKNARVNF